MGGREEGPACRDPHRRERKYTWIMPANYCKLRFLAWDKVDHFQVLSCMPVQVTCIPNQNSEKEIQDSGCMPVQVNCLSGQTSQRKDSVQWLYASLWLGLIKNLFIFLQGTSGSMPGSKGKLKIP